VARTDAPSTTGGGTVIRKDIQALRAFAVLAVVLYHLWPSRLPGGYAGVDVFFVISGFLISGQLLREVATTDRVALLRFYARRARRLLPAACLVLAVTGVATLLWVPYTQWAETGRQIVASAIYLENWALAGNSTDYLNSDAGASPVQHYWSLSVEEQFYLIWPALLIAVAVATRRRWAHLRRALTTVALAALALASLMFSVWYTHHEPSPAYFVTPTRLWEFAAGGLLATTGLVLRGRIAANVGWLTGGVMLVASLFLLDANSEFPGYVALLPVVGSALMIAVDFDSLPRLVRATESLRPVQLVGDVSYGMYLWHWPLIIIYPAVFGSTLTAAGKLNVLTASLLLAWAMKTYVEDPIRGSAMLRRLRPGWSLAGAGVIMAIVVAVGSVQAVDGTMRTDAAVAAAQHNSTSDPCYGAAALVGPNAQSCSVAGTGRGVDVLELAAAAPEDKPLPWTMDCIGDYRKPATGDECVVGDTTATKSLLLFGDSHAAAWVSAFDVVGKKLHLRVQAMVREACPPTAEAPTATPFRDISPTEQQRCARHNNLVLSKLRSDDTIQFVVTTARTSDYLYGPKHSASKTVSEQQYVSYLTQVEKLGLHVDVLQELPQTGTSETDRLNVPDCLAAHPQDVDACSQPRRAALSTGVLRQVTEQLPSDAVTFIETARYFCDTKRCYSFIGGLPVYFDASHLSDSYARSIGADLAGRLGGG
jgi:peptidoglycan/LPS O-acetylase OafA/YrhL